MPETDGHGSRLQAIPLMTVKYTCFVGIVDVIGAILIKDYTHALFPFCHVSRLGVYRLSFTIDFFKGYSVSLKHSSQPVEALKLSQALFPFCLLILAFFCFGPILR